MSSLFSGRVPQRVQIGRRPTENTFVLILELDASISETHARSVEITEHPVEAGVNVSDHVRQQPDNVVITGIISNTPAALPGTASGIAGGAVSNRDRDAFEILEDLQLNATIVTVISTIKVYDSMLLQNFTAPRDAGQGDSLNVTMTFRELLTAKTDFTQPPVTAQESSKATSSKGRQTPKTPAAETVESTNQSLLSQGISALF